MGTFTTLAAIIYSLLCYIKNNLVAHRKGFIETVWSSLSILLHVRANNRKTMPMTKRAAPFDVYNLTLKFELIVHFGYSDKHVGQPRITRELILWWNKFGKIRTTLHGIEWKAPGSHR